MNWKSLGLVLISAAACQDREPEAIASSTAPQLLPSEITVHGTVPPGSSGLVLTDQLIPCIGDQAMMEVFCAPTGDWATPTRMGGEGEGPGELQSATLLGPGTGGTLIVSDMGNRRLNWFDPDDGSFLRAHSAPGYFRQSLPESDGLVIGARMTPNIFVTSDPLTLRLVAIRSETGEVEWEKVFTVPEEDRDEDQLFLMSRGMRLPDGRVGTMLSRGRIAWWSAEGEYLGLVVSPDYTPRTYTESEAVERWLALKGARRRMGGAVPDSSETVREGMAMVRLPYRGEPCLGPNGTIWNLSTGDGITPGSDFEVFHGMDYLGRVHVDELVHEFDLEQNTLVILKDSGTIDEFGFEERDLRFYEIVLPSGIM